ncbi:MAG: hypothetical protein ACU84J_11160, partial [Gammaproteobacteria bacterium]
MKENTVQNLINKLSGLLLLSAILTSPAEAVELLINGNFETGDFSGWTATANGTGGCDTDWNVSSIGGSTATGCQPGVFGGNFPGAPGEGTFSAYNSFDGDAPQQFRLTQSFVVPVNIGNATLSWIETYNVDLTAGATTTRSFTV